MACGGCAKRKQKFLTNVKRAKKAQKQEVASIVDIPDDQLTPRQIRSKYRTIRAEKRRIRIQRRNAKANLVKQQNDLKALNEAKNGN
jgi:negative regulator of sigma E activity